MKEFAIILLNYNSWIDTIECLESLFKLDYLKFKIFVVDNSSDKNLSLNKIKAWCDGNLIVKDSNLETIVFPHVKKPIPYDFFLENELYSNSIKENLVLIKANENRGFAAGNNIVLNYILETNNSFDWIWLLNNDTVVKPNILSEVLKTSKNLEEDLVLIGTPLVEYYNPKIIQALGGKYNKYFSLTKHIGEGMSICDKIDFDNVHIDYPIGASMILSKKTLFQIGVLNEEYFLFFEELDWVERLKEQGGYVKVLDVFGVYHKQGKATDTKTNQGELKSEFIDLLFLRNRIAFTKKYFKSYTWIVMLFILIITSLKRLFKRDVKRVFKIYKLVLKEV